MDAPCKVQGSIHVFHLKEPSMCPGFWVHITSIADIGRLLFYLARIVYEVRASGVTRCTLPAGNPALITSLLPAYIPLAATFPVFTAVRLIPLIIMRLMIAVVPYLF